MNENMAMPVELREITAETVRTICGLEVAEEQRENVAPVAISIAQAHFEPRATFRAIYAGDEPVGFMLWRDDDKPNTAYLWRFMVDRRHQGKGYGRMMLQQLIESAQQQNYHLLIGGIDASNSGSIALHQKLGFVHSGTITQAGFKFGRWLDLAFYQLTLNTPTEPADG